MGLTPDEIRVHIERILQSKTFETSEVHRRLLEYLAVKTLAGEADRLKEYTIGLEAFSKPSTYDPRQDSIVRLQVGRLRQKLLAYYEAEAGGDTLRVTLPKGGYRLEFHAATATNHAEGASSARHRNRLIWQLAAGLVAATVWAAVASVGLVMARNELSFSRARWSPELESLWAPFVKSERPLLVCLGTPLFVRFPSYGFFRDPKTNDWQEMEKSARMNRVREALGDKDVIPWYAFTGAGEASGAFLLGNLLSSRKHDIRLSRSSIISWQEIVDSNVVFVGPPKFNLQLQATPILQDLVVEPNGIRNLHPRAGEPEFLPDRVLAGKQSEGETHALISHTSGLSGVGEFLVVAGNASADTFAAAQWMTQPWRARELTEHLRNSKGQLPHYYQVVLRVAFKQGIPVQSSYLFHHVLKDNAQAGQK